MDNSLCFFTNRAMCCPEFHLLTFGICTMFLTPQSECLFAVRCAHGHKLSQVLYLLFPTVSLPAIKHLYNVLFSGPG